MARLADYVREKCGQTVTYIDFENDILKTHLTGTKNWATFLAQDSNAQFDLWSRGWVDFKKRRKSGITILGLHGCYISGIVGLRSPIDLPKLCKDFNPTLIVTLVDDVFEMWSRTEERAGGRADKGRPTLEQLLVARRAEQFVGDLILNHLRNSEARHILYSVGNTLAGLSNLIVFDAPVTYLSFPISAPRKLAATGDMSFIEKINLAHSLALSRMQTDSKRCFVSPLSIDELPLKKLADADQIENLSFDIAKLRWSLSDLWGVGGDALVLHSEPRSLKLRRTDVLAAGGTIETDVGWRDRRLVLQSHSLAIVCPKPPREERVTRGVADEVEMAVSNGIPCCWWQEPSWDVNEFVDGHWPAAGSMGIGHTQALVRKVASLEELVDAEP